MIHLAAGTSAQVGQMLWDLAARGRSETVVLTIRPGSAAALSDLATLITDQMHLFIGWVCEPIGTDELPLIDTLDLCFGGEGVFDETGDPRPFSVVDNIDSAISNMNLDPPDYAILAMALLLRSKPRQNLSSALVAESFAYSMLLSGPMFQTWLADR